MRLRVYVAGPYSAPTEEGKLDNTNRAMDAGVEVMNRGHHPFVPHLTHFMDVRCEEVHGHRKSWGEWMSLDESYLDVCDVLLYLGPSKGADIEKARAEELGLQIITSPRELPVYVGG